MKKLLWFLPLFIPLMGIGQDSLNTKGKSCYSLSYTGNNLINPGLAITWEKSIRSKIKSKSKTKKKTGETYTRLKNREFLHELEVGFWNQPNTYGVAFLGYDIAYRRTGYLRIRYKWALGVNYVNTILPTTYSAEEGEAVKKMTLAGRSYIAPHFVMGFGRMTKNPSALLRAWHCNIRGMFLLNYNDIILPMLNLELGVTLNRKKS